MVGSGLPEHVLPLLALVASCNVLERQKQRMTKAQRPGFIRWRHANSERLFFALWLSGKYPCLLPEKIDRLLVLIGLINFGKFHGKFLVV